jgi:hypothetical protein
VLPRVPKNTIVFSMCEVESARPSQPNGSMKTGLGGSEYLVLGLWGLCLLRREEGLEDQSSVWHWGLSSTWYSLSYIRGESHGRRPEHSAQQQRQPWTSLAFTARSRSWQVVFQISNNSSIDRLCKARAPMSAKEIRRAVTKGAEHSFIQTLIKQWYIQLKHAFFKQKSVDA